MALFTAWLAYIFRKELKQDKFLIQISMFPSQSKIRSQNPLEWQSKNSQVNMNITLKLHILVKEEDGHCEYLMHGVDGKIKLFKKIQYKRKYSYMYAHSTL
jgi:hypothetical protein